MFTEQDFKVTLVNKEDVSHFVEKHGEFACVCYGTPKQNAKSVGKHCLQSGHLSGSRHLYFVFDLKCIPRFTIDQLVRHEVGVVKNVQSLRYCTKRNNINVYCPRELYSEPQERFEFQRTEEYLTIVNDRLMRLLPHTTDISKERLNEIARTFIPIGIESECSFAINLEGLINLCNKRLCNRAEKPIYYLVRKMALEVIKVEPLYEKLLVPQCDKLGYCPEIKGCGKYEPPKN